jgi:RNA polymerase sigma-70 factor (ECF subfamily)
VTALPDSLFAAARFVEATDSPVASSEPRSERVEMAVLYAKLAPAVHRFLRDLLGDAALAADATQETFVRAFRRYDTLEDCGRVAPWIFGIARNVSLELRRARGRARRVIVDGDGEADCEARAKTRTPEAELLDREAVRVVASALERLSEDRRAALLLRLDHGLAYDEIAELMGWTLAKVKVEIFRAREVLRATVEEYERCVK